MSLINKMLKDLESRENAAAPAKNAYADLRSVNYSAKRSVSPRVVFLSGTVVIAVTAVAAYYFLGMRPSPTPKVVAQAPVAASVAETSPPPVVTQGPLTQAPAPVVALPVAKEKTPEPRPALAPPAKKPTPVPVVARKPTPEPVVAQKAEPNVVEKRDVQITPQEQAETRYRDAAQLLGQGRQDEARATLTQALEVYPNHRKARELSAALALQAGRIDEAQTTLAQGLKLTPDHLPFTQLLARTFLEQGNEAQAIETLEGARNVAANNPDYLSFLAALYQRAGRHADAAKAYQDTVALRPTSARAWLGLGISLEATKNPDAATAYSRALQLGGLDTTLSQYAQQRLAALKK